MERSAIFNGKISKTQKYLKFVYSERNRKMNDPIKMAASAFPRPDISQYTITEWFQELSNWGRWGSHDELGALNLITPEKRCKAATLVRQGVSVSMARDAIKERVGVSAPFEHIMVESGETPGAESAGDIFSVQYHGYTQTHLDALCHVFHGNFMFNGLPKHLVSGQGATKLSVLAIKDGIFTRGVLIDMPRAMGKSYLTATDAIYPEHLSGWMEKVGIEVKSGDALIVRTGRWAREKEEGRWDIESGSAGLHASCLPWLREHDVSVLVSDLASDLMPSQVEGVRLPIHLVTIAGLGVPIIDNCDLEKVAELSARQERWEFLFVASPLAVPGGTGSPINPIAVY
jgi:kynurenine formamidase